MSQYAAAPHDAARMPATDRTEKKITAVSAASNSTTAILMAIVSPTPSGKAPSSTALYTRPITAISSSASGGYTTGASMSPKVTT